MLGIGGVDGFGIGVVELRFGLRLGAVGSDGVRGVVGVFDFGGRRLVSRRELGGVVGCLVDYLLVGVALFDCLLVCVGLVGLGVVGVVRLYSGRACDSRCDRARGRDLPRVALIGLFCAVGFFCAVWLLCAVDCLGAVGVLAASGLFSVGLFRRVGACDVDVVEVGHVAGVRQVVAIDHRGVGGARRGRPGDLHYWALVVRALAVRTLRL